MAHEAAPVGDERRFRVPPSGLGRKDIAGTTAAYRDWIANSMEDARRFERCPRGDYLLATLCRQHCRGECE